MCAAINLVCPCELMALLAFVLFSVSKSIASRLWVKLEYLIQPPSDSSQVIGLAQLLTTLARLDREKTSLLWLLQNRCPLAIVHSPIWVNKTSSLIHWVPSNLSGTETLAKGECYSNRQRGMLVGAVMVAGLFECPALVVAASMVSKWVFADDHSLRLFMRFLQSLNISCRSSQMASAI